MQPLITSNVQRGLSYLLALNSSDVYPTTSQVDAFVYTEVPRSAVQHFLEDDWNSSLGFAESIAGGDSVARYLLDIGLAIVHGGGVSLSKAGRAMAVRASSDVTGEGPAAVLQVAGRFDDPVMYARFLTEVDKQESALVIDPYIPPDALFTLVDLPGVRRILTKDTAIKGQDRETRKRHLAIAVGIRPEVELRFLPAELKELHDRYVLPESAGEGIMIGTSLGATQLTVITHLSADLTQLLRQHYDSLWEASEPLQPIARESRE